MKNKPIFILILAYIIAYKLNFPAFLYSFASIGTLEFITTIVLTVLIFLVIFLNKKNKDIQKFMKIFGIVLLIAAILSLIISQFGISLGPVLLLCIAIIPPFSGLGAICTSFPLFYGAIALIALGIIFSSKHKGEYMAKN